MRELSGKSEARGRNGWFKPTRFAAWPNQQFGHIAVLEETPISVEVWSKSSGNTAPIVFRLTVEDAKALTGAIYNALIDARAFTKEDVAWPWCEACGSYHHPKNPTCANLNPVRCGTHGLNYDSTCVACQYLLAVAKGEAK